MQVAVGFAIALIAVFFLVLLAGLSPFIGIPIAVFLGVIPVLWLVATRRLTEEKATLKSDVPSTAEASYQPAVDPAERR
jgi:hypothetical protein